MITMYKINHFNTQQHGFTIITAVYVSYIDEIFIKSSSKVSRLIARFLNRFL